ncbi:DUF3145 domain-containing protein [Sesbania bispinosa]|nr:DUF3145 domain-containing protein [Sesbania bispinosa]
MGFKEGSVGETDAPGKVANGSKLPHGIKTMMNVEVVSKNHLRFVDKEEPTSTGDATPVSLPPEPGEKETDAHGEITMDDASGPCPG